MPDGREAGGALSKVRAGPVVSPVPLDGSGLHALQDRAGALAPLTRKGPGPKGRGASQLRWCDKALPNCCGRRQAGPSSRLDEASRYRHVRKVNANSVGDHTRKPQRPLSCLQFRQLCTCWPHVGRSRPAEAPTKRPAHAAYSTAYGCSTSHRPRDTTHRRTELRPTAERDLGVPLSGAGTGSHGGRAVFPGVRGGVGPPGVRRLGRGPFRRSSNGR